MELTAMQRITLKRLADGGSGAGRESRVALRWLRRYGLLDADHQVTDAGRAYLEHQRQEQERRVWEANSRNLRGRPEPLERTRDAIRRWQAGERG